jgi:hypothetical protein
MFFIVDFRPRVSHIVSSEPQDKMVQQNNLLRELDSQIRAAYAELGTLQLRLVDAHERELNAAQLGVCIANLGRQIAAWKRERQSLSCSASQFSTPAKEVPPHDRCPAKTANARVAVASLRAVAPTKNPSHGMERLSKRSYSLSAAHTALK